jgi:hypothetical protein
MVSKPPDTASSGAADPEAAARMREEMGRALAERRRAADLSQDALGELIGYHRTQVSHAETACRDDIQREFWQAVDRVFKSGRYFTSRYDRMRACMEPVSQVRVPAAELKTGIVLQADDIAEAFAAYRRFTWPVTDSGDRVELVTGTITDALEVAPATGRLAAHWWQETGGREDVARGLPPLPPPASSLAVVDTGEHWYFLVRSGVDLWSGDGDGRSGTTPDTVTVRWHAAGGRILLPPSAAGEGSASWACLPSRGVRLAPPLAVLSLLGRAAAMTRTPGVLTLSGGMIVAPARD